MDCYSQLQCIHDEISNETGFSYARLDELKSNNQLDIMFKNHNIDYLFKQEFDEFLNILESNRFNNHEYLRRLHLNNCRFLLTVAQHGYMLSLFLNNKDSYRVFPLFFKECVNHYNIERYKDMSLEDIENLFSNYFEIEKKYDYRNERNLIIARTKPAGLYTTYAKYDEKLNNMSPINCKDQEEFFVYSEYEAYQRELANISSYNFSEPKELVKWVARYYGDGFGYDVLSFDVKNNKEKLIEVKSSKCNKYELTEGEYHTMLCAVNNNCDYYVYTYYYNEEKNIVKLSILKYDKEKNVLIDINTYEQYLLNPYFYPDGEKQRFKAEIIYDEEYNKTYVRERVL